MSSKKSEAESTRANLAQLTKQYGAIGPAAVVAALMYMKKRKPLQGASPKPA